MLTEDTHDIPAPGRLLDVDIAALLPEDMLPVFGEEVLKVAHAHEGVSGDVLEELEEGYGDVVPCSVEECEDRRLLEADVLAVDGNG